MTDPRDNRANKPTRDPDITEFGEGEPPRNLPAYDRKDAVYRELFFEGMSSDEYPRGWWALNVWLKRA